MKKLHGDAQTCRHCCGVVVDNEGHNTRMGRYCLVTRDKRGEPHLVLFWKLSCEPAGLLCNPRNPKDVVWVTFR